MDTPTPMPAAPVKSTAFLSIFPKVALPMILAMVDQSIVATALPAIAGSLGTVQQISLVMIGYLIATTIVTPVYGRLGDVYGRRRFLLVALGIFLFGAMLCSLAPTLPLLTAGRIIQGLGGGGLMALSQALIGEAVEPRDRARYQGYLASIGVVSNGIGPVIGGILTELFGWRSIFLIYIPLVALAVAMIWRLPRRAASGQRFQFDYVGLLLFAVFVVSLLLLLDRMQRFNPAQIPLMIALFTSVAVSFWMLIAYERRARSPLIPLELFRNATIWRANVIAGCHGGIIVSLLTFVPIYLRVVHETSASQTGLLIVPMTVCIGIGSLITGQIISRTGRTAAMPTVTLVLVVAGLIVMAFKSADMRPLDLSIALGLVAFFLGPIMSVVQVSVQIAAGPQSIGAAAAAVQYCRSLGAALVTALVATVLFATLTWTDPEAGRLFGLVLQDGASALEGLAAGRSEIIQAEFAGAFRAGFLVIAGVAALAWYMNFTLPMRRI